MTVKIEHVSSHSEEDRVVRLGSRHLRLPHERCAKDFAAKLKARIEAPHANLQCNQPADRSGRLVPRAR